MLMEISLPNMGELLVMMMTMISPSGSEVPPTESLRRRAKVLLSKFRLETTMLRKVLSLFFLGQNDLYTRRWAPEVGLGEHNPRGRAWAPQRTQVGCAHLVGPLWQLFAPIIIKYSIKSPWSFSLFGVVQNRQPDVAFPGPDFQLPEFSLFVYTLHIMRERALELL